VGRSPLTSGIAAIGHHRIRFDFMFEGRRYRPSVLRTPTETNLRRAREQLSRIKARIEAGTFSFADEFPGFRDLQRVPDAGSPRTCGQVFDAFLKHCESRLAKNDMAAITVGTYRRVLNYFWRQRIGDSHFLSVRYSMLVAIADEARWSKKTYNNAISVLRRAFKFGYRDFPERHDPTVSLKSARIRKKDRPVIDPFTIQDAETLIAEIHRDWGEAQGNYDEFRFFTGLLRFFTGLRPSEQVALVVSDFDPTGGMLTINKACVGGVNKDSTKTSEDRHVALCPRTIQVLRRQIALRESLKRVGKIDHDRLFFKETGEPIRNLQYAHVRWRRTLARLPEIRYRKPYCARHSSVSWNLMIGQSALWVARQHGHSIATMLRVYAAWTEGAGEGDLEAIKRAMAARPSNLSRSGPAPREREKFPDRDLALDLSLARMVRQLSSGNQTRLMAEREGFEPSKGF
jgi:integrase